MHARVQFIRIAYRQCMYRLSIYLGHTRVQIDVHHSYISMLMECDERTKFLVDREKNRKMRLMEKEVAQRVVQLQTLARRYLTRRQFETKIRREMDSLLVEDVDLEQDQTLPECEFVLRSAAVFLYVMKSHEDLQNFCRLCQYIILSMSSTDVKSSFVGLFLSEKHIKAANRLITKIFGKILSCIDELKMTKVVEARSISLFVHFMVIFLGCNSWALIRDNVKICAVLSQMCNKILTCSYSCTENYSKLSSVLVKTVASGRLMLSSNVFNGIFSIFFRLLKNANFSSDECILFVRYCLTCPTLIIYLSKANIDALVMNSVFEKAIHVLSLKSQILSEIKGNHILFLLANLVHLSFLDQNGLVGNLLDWTHVMNKILNECDQFVHTAIGKSSHWHPILGWFSEPLDRSIEGSLHLVSKQLQYLWSKPVVYCLFDRVLRYSCVSNPISTQHSNQPVSDLSLSIQKLLRKLNIVGTEVHPNASCVLSPLSATSVVCELYQSAFLTLKTLRADILAGLSREDFLLPQLWEHIVSLSPNDNGLSYHLSLMQSHPSVSTHFAPLTLFVDTAFSVISILDEEEMYVKGEPFNTEQLCAVARLCNLFCFKCIWNSYINLSKWTTSPVFHSLYELCMLLYHRDCRRQFTKDQKFWIASDVRSSVIMSEFEKVSDRAVFLLSRMSHLVALHERIVLFRKYVASEKEGMQNISSTMIGVQRGRILEDGYRQLSKISNNLLKGTIRVKFVNLQGLDEAGIDQDGVFKEFLELIVKEVFNPDLSLFKSSADGRLYPSQASHVHENHLQLFYFIGRILAKAVYEGIVTDVFLSPVLLATILGRKLCAFDELSQLDPDLYKSLTCVKHYGRSSDVTDLSLTFSVDECILGQVKTIDLIPGGRVIHVTNINRIAYVHKMAHYRVFTQTKQQCEAFVAGFKSVLDANWLSLFAPHELQYLISGQKSDIDLHDLKKHVQYYGGFHGNHRVIKWLWQILESEFSSKERNLFLKFVTSCSRAPLLGFAYLEPKFSIRCVEVSDDQDQGDTLVSVVRGFLAIKRHQSPTRLPTASTCFNLLKLPNYAKKSILLQKLRYAIHADTGFELS